jgi:hypothetical protein
VAAKSAVPTKPAAKAAPAPVKTAAKPAAKTILKKADVKKPAAKKK